MSRIFLLFFEEAQFQEISSPNRSPKSRNVQFLCNQLFPDACRDHLILLGKRLEPFLRTVVKPKQGAVFQIMSGGSAGARLYDLDILIPRHGISI